MRNSANYKSLYGNLTNILFGTVSGIKYDKNGLPCFPVVLLVSA